MFKPESHFRGKKKQNSEKCHPALLWALSLCGPPNKCQAREGQNPPWN